MFTLIGDAGRYVGSYLAVPINWFLALPFVDWQLPAVVMVIVAAFYSRIVVNIYLAAHAAAESHEDRKHQRRWDDLYKLSPDNFAALIEKMEAEAAKHDARAEALIERANDPRARYLPGLSRSLLKQADTDQASALFIRSEIVERHLLWSYIVKQREQEPPQRSTLARMIEMAPDLNSADERTALEALVGLSALRNVSWSEALPKTLPPASRAVLLKCLNVMSGTGNLGEARNAFNKALSILQQHSMEWEDLAA